MGAMERLHPLAAAGYFAGVAAVAMVSMNPAGPHRPDGQSGPDAAEPYPECRRGWWPP